MIVIVKGKKGQTLKVCKQIRDKIIEKQVDYRVKQE